MVPPTMAIKWLTFALLLSALFSAEAQTINAASCSASDVQTAFNSVVNSTTTVNIPSCSGTGWTTQVKLTVPSGSTTLTVQGSTAVSGTCSPGGSCTASDSTVIVDNYASNNSPLIVTTGNSSSFFRLTGITFKGGTGTVKYQG